MNRMLDWRLRAVRKKTGLPDLPEVRALMRISWWNGFTFGALEHRVTAARREALNAVARDQRRGG